MSSDHTPSDGRSDEATPRNSDSTSPIPSSGADTTGQLPTRDTDATSPLPRQESTGGYQGTPYGQQRPPYGQQPGQSSQSGQQQPGQGSQGQSAQSGYPGYGQPGPNLARPGNAQHNQGQFGQQPGPRPQQPGFPPYAGGAQQPATAHHSQSHPSYDTTGGATPPRRSRSWVAVPAAAIIAAVLASGGTWALAHNDNSSSASGTSTTVVKADPADLGDANSVNWAATASKVSPSVVSITVTAGQSGDQGSGVILDAAGNIVTNNHVVTGAGANPTITVTLNNNETYAAKVVGTDVSTDLAVVRLVNPPSDLKPITFGDDSKLVVGQPVMAVGNPLGLSGTVTTGIVSALNRPVTTTPDSSGESSSQAATESATTNAIQTSAAINPGNSGGALVNGTGQLIGINSSIATLGQSLGSSQSGNIGIGFAIPVTVVKNITSQLIKTGKAVHSEIGVSVDSQPATVTIGNATQQAAKIVSVASGSPAQKAGIKAGDVVTAFNGQQVVSSDALIGFVREEPVGAKVVLTIIRNGQQLNVTVTLGEASSTN
ncbi:S1C family serine protease [Rudaeicoccus suwonensis]|uniref:Putative serine protease PepD n=1 Tax=Rudaeicoccus suwonensis TaxID=657409 RepID=A0A561E7U6_9MICO|nr:trypsin-like peptidase domain-containing protein [Rudaeicoccus suwonensis]TWE11681.1 putative serine protease PepD [Rudaeicoccus suwonensis]